MLFILYRDCICNSGYYRYAAICVKCDTKCKCNGITISSCWLPNFTYSDLKSGQILPIVCPSYSPDGSNQCNPHKKDWNGSDIFPCENGYQGRMFSQCSKTYYANGLKCKQCFEYAKWYLPTIYVFISAVLSLYVWHVPATDSAAIKIASFHFQSLLILVYRCGLQWHGLDFFFSGSGGLLSYVAIECLIDSWNLFWSLSFAVATPLIVTLFAITSWSFSKIFSIALYLSPFQIDSSSSYHEKHTHLQIHCCFYVHLLFGHCNNCDSNVFMH